MTTHADYLEQCEMTATIKAARARAAGDVATTELYERQAARHRAELARVGTRKHVTAVYATN